MTRLLWWQRSLVGTALAALAFLYLPIGVLILFSFNASKVTTFPLAGFTTDWYARVFANTEMLHALANSLSVAVSATVLAVLLGVPAALALDRHHFPGKHLFQTTLLLPLSLPGIVTGIAMLNFYKQIGLPLSLATVVIGHATALIGVVVSQVMARLAKVNRRLEEASADLGATPFETFRRVTLPSIRSAVIGSALLTFTLSFDEIPVTYFLTGREITLPIYIYSTLRRGITPEINAIGTLIVAASILLILVSVVMIRDRR
ncbi:ABC transporter permease [Segnochrobactrum spirostomi]|uniref:ABC transporter permease n=1 Tax=Segnochrobactrum spirostomi TaxID=2608987 RepID=A0A6A7Y6A1_9HYPH|nr:ABC transporter permease [Segnochrobactrum spirostomi]MQT14820.1 ABC transporter permease [Segnochrobactrum spirostomi]